MIGNLQQKLKTPYWRRILTFALILIGVGLILYFGTNSVRSFQRVRYVQEQGLETGEASVDAIRGWMNIRYIGVAYAVPEEYIYARRHRRRAARAARHERAGRRRRTTRTTYPGARPTAVRRPC